MNITPMLPLPILIPVLGVALALVVWQVIRHRGTRLAREWSLRLLMLLLLAAVALRPGVGGTEPGPAAEGGLEVYFVVDTTSSMAAEDFGDEGSPRLSGVRADISALAQTLAGAEFALITFDSSAVQRMPLTSDLSALRSAVTVLTQEVTNYSAGSSIDASTELLTRVLADAEEAHPDRPRVVYYFGDGEQTVATEPGSFAALEPSIDGGAVLGYGTEEGGRMLSYDGYADMYSESTYIQDFTTTPPTDAISRIDETRLQSIADQLGVSYEHRDSGQGVDSLVRGIEFETPDVTTETGTAPTELYWILVIPLLALLVREWIGLARALRETRGVE
ncbi:Ca-activated chloride channel family protein [Glaciihabitans tibetensis]|uniref:Ca-activated chloride channel family protein n=1 Tax=Glaciihabitans tibetensis TaxID=1266600 RepID=A0A2T0VHJ8_9MICO|nr:VWA domain-containing protein [Glaciihabitans tibetensis]PRY69641.1 Ca-activated chloride channel family protein [Glaciihabitans tibetensis]